MNQPGIVTALPKHRYTFGEFSVVVLGEIDSNDGVDYRFVAAVVQGQNPQPGLYITAEAVGEKQPPYYDMRVIMHDGSEVVGSSAEWGQLDVFTDEALQVISKILDLGDETPYRLM